MKRKIIPLSLFLSLVSSANGAIEIQTESASALFPNEDDALLVYVDDFSSGDLINEGSPSLLDWTSTPAFGSGGVGNSFVAEYMNDGVYERGDKKNTYFDPSRLPAVVTYNLDLSVATLGYNLTSIATFMGWGFESRVHVHQDYKIEYSVVGSADYVLLTDVLFTPFADLTDFEGNYESKVKVIENDSGVLATGVDSVRFTFNDTGGPAGDFALGTVIREIDVVGFAVGGDPNAIVVTAPTERQIVQRNISNVANIPVEGTFVSIPDSVEARAVVKVGGENNGTTTPWQTIENAPIGGTFSGSLSNVPAGGWYEIEVRSVTDGDQSDPVTIGRVGVGDIFICAGQSNSANNGTPAATPTSDRVSARDMVDDNSWVPAADPMPIAEGTMGSPWTRLGDLIVGEEDVPVGFLSLGRNSSSVSAWSPGSSNDNDFMNPAIKSFPQDGFRAILWHQGEADSALGTTASAYRSSLIGIINHGRGVNGADWNIPWYVSEASFQPSSSPLTVEEGILSGQRQVAFDISNVYLGADTNDFHLEERSSDGVHFNAAGLAEHARQWFEVIYQRAPAGARNGDFELNTEVSLTGEPPLAENAFEEAVPSADDGVAVLDWRILKASGDASADGANGYFNPGSDTYSNGFLANMTGPHAATMRGGSANNYFLQTLRTLAKPNKSYFLSAAFGKRDVGADIYAGARLELLHGSSVISSTAVDSNKLNLVAGGDATGKFTNVTLRHDTGVLAGQTHELAVRILKVGGGVNTYLDFDSVVLSELNTSSGFVTWLNSHSLVAGPNLDSDGDGLRNLVEYALGTSPLVPDAISVLGNTVGGAIRMTRRKGSVGGLAYSIESSTDLSPESWTTLGGVVESVVSTNGDFETVDLTRDGGWFPGAEDELYYRLKVEITD